MSEAMHEFTTTSYNIDTRLQEYLPFNLTAHILLAVLMHYNRHQWHVGTSSMRFYHAIGRNLTSYKYPYVQTPNRAIVDP